MNKNKSKLKKVIKKNKKILLILGSVLIIALIAFIILFATRLKKERVVIKEVDKIGIAHVWTPVTLVNLVKK